MAEYFRLVLNNPPTAEDFMSDAALGKQPGYPLRTPELWEGISVYDEAELARNRALVSPHLGRHIGTLDLIAGEEVSVRRTGKADGHYTVWANAETLLASVVSVLPV